MNGASWGLRLLPTSARYVPAEATIAALSPLLKKQRRIAELNFALAFNHPAGSAEPMRLARESQRNYARMGADFLRLRTMTPQEVLRWGQPWGEEYLAAARKQGRGVIFALAHFGSWDVAAAYAQAFGQRLTLVTESSWSSELVASSRLGKGLQIAPREKALRLVFRALSRNECVAIISDLVEDEFQTGQVQFFGRATRFPLGPARLARRTGAGVMVCAAVRLKDGTYRVEGKEPLWADPAVPEKQAVLDLTAAIALRFEILIRAFPEQWYPFRPVWPELIRGVPVVKQPVPDGGPALQRPGRGIVRKRSAETAGEDHGR
jgi:KDO2-lipid IV(A) lauroyltransferase